MSRSPRKSKVRRASRPVVAIGRSRWLRPTRTDSSGVEAAGGAPIVSLYALSALLRPGAGLDPEELAQVGIEDSSEFDPGTQFQYSNTNPVLLGLVLEKVTGKPIGELYRQWLIEPLGLQETSFPDTDPSRPEPYAHGYTLQGQSDGKPADATVWNPSWGWTAGAMISRVDDLLVYGQALGTGEALLPPERRPSGSTPSCVTCRRSTPT
jgi:CubicO group peptidase (beta-lactamase class C family)